MRPEIQRVQEQLPKLCPELEFLPVVVHTPEDASKLLTADERDGITGYIVYQMNNWIQVMQPIVAAGRPTIVAQFIYGGSGGFLVYTAGLRKKYENIAVISSSKIEDLAAAARCFRLIAQGASPSEFVEACERVRRESTPAASRLAGVADSLQLTSPREVLEALAGSKILAVGRYQTAVAGSLEETMKISVVRVDFPEFSAAYEATDVEEAREIAARWRNQARKIDIPEPEETLEKSARVYLAQQLLLEKHQATAITINCLGGFYGGHLAGYPCLGFVELNNAGQIGACEADLISTATMMAGWHLANRPGYISDPVLDSSKRQIIYAHCVAPTKVLGPQGPKCEFEILTHNEDRKGASVRSLLPLGYMTTTCEIHPVRKEILCHRGVAVENVDEDRGCRTKLAVEPLGDYEKLYTYWDLYGWHRVTFYGDLWEPLQELAKALGFAFVAET